MAGWSKWLWGGLGWALGGPLGGILGFALGAIGESEQPLQQGSAYSKTLPGDFGSALLVLCGALMRADNKLLKSELDYVKRFFVSQFGEAYAKERMLLFREILKQDYDIQPVCIQIRQHLDYSSRLQLIHLLYGLAASDGDLHKEELSFIERVCRYMEISGADMNSMKAMFVKDANASYKILEIEPAASDDEVKKAYRRMAMKYHPDKVHHLGPQFQKDAQDKFKSINEAYEAIKKQRGIN
jgi:DnaJ like chaperone protein